MSRQMINISLSKKKKKPLKKNSYSYNINEVNHRIYNDLPLDPTKLSKQK